MSIDFTNQSPAVLLINNYPIVFGAGIELKKVSEMIVGKAEDKKPLNWGSFSNFFSDPASKSGIELHKGGKYKNSNLDGINTKNINTVFIRPVFSGLELDIEITQEEYGALYPIIKPLINFLYRQGLEAKQFTSFYSLLYYIVDGYLESSAVSQESKDGLITWHLVIKAKQSLADSLENNQVKQAKSTQKDKHIKGFAKGF